MSNLPLYRAIVMTVCDELKHNRICIVNLFHCKSKECVIIPVEVNLHQGSAFSLSFQPFSTLAEDFCRKCGALRKEEIRALEKRGIEVSRAKTG